MGGNGVGPGQKAWLGKDMDPNLTSYNDSQKQLSALLGKAPAQLPDLSDPTVQAARQAALLNTQIGQTRKSTLLTGGQGLPAPTMGSKTLLGG